MDRCVLVVEDDKGIVKVLSIFLKSRGYEILAATNGKQAVEIARQECPDVILLDFLLPDISGFEVLEQVRQFSPVPIIIFSANRSVVEKALNAGATDSIAKPFNPDRLLEKIESVLTGNR